MQLDTLLHPARTGWNVVGIAGALPLGFGVTVSQTVLLEIEETIARSAFGISLVHFLLSVLPLVIMFLIRTLYVWMIVRQGFAITGTWFDWKR